MGITYHRILLGSFCILFQIIAQSLTCIVYVQLFLRVQMLAIELPRFLSNSNVLEASSVVCPAVTEHLSLQFSCKLVNMLRYH